MTIGKKLSLLWINLDGTSMPSFFPQNFTMEDTQVQNLSLLKLNEWIVEEHKISPQLIVVNIDDLSQTKPLDDWALQAWRATLNELVTKCMSQGQKAPTLLAFTKVENWERAVLAIRIGVRDIVTEVELSSRLSFYKGEKIITSKNEENIGLNPVLKFSSTKNLTDKLKEVTPAETTQETTKLPKHLIPFPIDGLEGTSSAIEALRSLVRKTASLDTTILINGPTGSGKELVAQTLHRYSSRNTGPFVAVNCGALSPELFESEFFGHVKGAFTSAFQDKDGLFKAANHGTLFLDEVSEIPYEHQAKLLRALQEKEVRPVGASASIPFDVRIVAATQNNLSLKVEEKKFREDLYYRLKVIEIELPSLSERRADLPEIAQSILKKISRRHRRPLLQLSSEALEKCLFYKWPGNIRELENILERAATLCWAEERDNIMVGDLPENIQFATMESRGHSEDLKEIVHRFEKEYIASTVRRLGGSKEQAAEVLGLSLATLYRKLA